MIAYWYDKKDSIVDEIVSLKALNNLLAERRTAGYDRHEKLHEFCILGTYMLDSCGNCGVIDRGFIPREMLPNLPSVVTYEELWQYINEYDLKLHPDVLTGEEMRSKDFDWSKNKRPFPTSVTYSINDLVPLHDKVCPVCGKGWTIKNPWDTFVAVTFESIDVKADEHHVWIGKTIAQLRQWLKERTDSECFISTKNNSFLRNDRYIDLTPKPDYPTLKENERGWVGETVIIDPENYVIQKGDEISYIKRTYMHKACNKLYQEKKIRDEFFEVIRKAGVTTAILHPVANQYCPCELCSSWFIVETPYTPISESLKGLMIGWRKRVINIQFDHSCIDFMKLFPEEDVTKGLNYIHAWGYEKAQEYLRKIFDTLKNSTPDFVKPKQPIKPNSDEMFTPDSSFSKQLEEARAWQRDSE
jgi:hypothetical protein